VEVLFLGVLLQKLVLLLPFMPEVLLYDHMLLALGRRPSTHHSPTQVIAPGLWSALVDTHV